MMKSVLTLLFAFFASITFAQSQAINGRIFSESNKPLPLVSVSLLIDSTLIAGAISNDDGTFSLNASLKAGIKYTCRFSLVGYNNLDKSFTFPNTSSLSEIKLTPRDKMLGEVVVTSNKPLVSRKADRYLVNVEDSYLANGHNGLEVLQRSPGLWVSPNGDIRIIGGQTVTVMINDVVQRMPASDVSDFIRTLRSEDISRIEVIPNPPSEFEAASSGGIIHIILKKARKDGLTGSANLIYRQQRKKPYMGAGTSIDYKLQRFYLFGGFNMSSDRNSYMAWNNVTYPDHTGIYNYTDRHNNNSRYQFRAGIVYDFSPKHSINFQAIGAATVLDQEFISQLRYTLPDRIVTGIARSEWLRKPWQGSYTLNYGWKIDSLGSTLRVIADYTTSTKPETNETRSNYSDILFDKAYRTSTPSVTHISSAQADYTLALRDQTMIRTGIKGVHTGRDNMIRTDSLNQDQWIKDEEASNEFRYTEKLLMFYASYEKRFGRTSIKAGLRGEQTWADGLSITTNESINRKYFGWFPSFFITTTLNEEHATSVNINYSRRVRRPGYNDLNPYRLQVHDFTILTGNPDLVPQYTHSFRAAYNFRNDYSVGAYLQTTQNFIAQTATTLDSNIIEYKSKNYPNSTEYGVFIEGTFTIGKIWTSRNSAYFYQLSNKIDGFRHRQQSFSMQSIQVIKLKNVVDIDMGIQFTSAILQANQLMGSVLYSDFGVVRKVLRDKGRLRFSIADIFNTARERQTTHFNNTHIDFYQKRPTRTFSLSFNYTFQAGKAFTKKKIDSNDSEEKSRL